LQKGFKFSKRDQLDGKTINEFVDALLRLSAKCCYGNFLDDALAERFVCGLKSQVKQNKLLTAKNFNFRMVIQIANNLQQASVEKQQCNQVT